jgi:hypothetical protein
MILSASQSFVGLHRSKALTAPQEWYNALEAHSFTTHHALHFSGGPMGTFDATVVVLGAIGFVSTAMFFGSLFLVKLSKDSEARRGQRM